MLEILCIDDEPDFRVMLKEFIALWGYGALEACDGADGLTQIVERKPALVICDRKMPRLSGYEMLTLLREKFPQFNETPFIFLTALDDVRDINAVEDLRPTRYLTKPIDFLALRAAIEELLEEISLRH
ncbi:MAG: response regulator [Pseudomonadota bacterium]